MIIRLTYRSISCGHVDEAFLSCYVVAELEYAHGQYHGAERIKPGVMQVQENSCHPEAHQAEGGRVSGDVLDFNQGFRKW